MDDNRARKLSNELRRCSYYETCATYGLNVERVFQDGKCNETYTAYLCLDDVRAEDTIIFYRPLRGFRNVLTVSD